MKCDACGNDFILGTDGIITLDGNLFCDNCANITRNNDGYIYDKSHSYEINRPVRYLCMGAGGIHRGDFVTILERGIRNEIRN